MISKKLAVTRLHDLLTGNEVELIESTYHSAEGVENMRFLLRMPGGSVVKRRSHEIRWSPPVRLSRFSVPRTLHSKPRQAA